MKPCWKRLSSGASARSAGTAGRRPPFRWDISRNRRPPPRFPACTVLPVVRRLTGGRRDSASPRMDVFVRGAGPTIRSPQTPLANLRTGARTRSSPPWPSAGRVLGALRGRRVSGDGRRVSLFRPRRSARHRVAGHKDRRQRPAPPSRVPSCSTAALLFRRSEYAPEFPGVLDLAPGAALDDGFIARAGRIDRARSSAGSQPARRHDGLVEERVAQLEPRYRTLDWGRRLSNGPRMLVPATCNCSGGRILLARRTVKTGTLSASHPFYSDRRTLFSLPGFPTCRYFTGEAHV